MPTPTAKPRSRRRSPRRLAIVAISGLAATLVAIPTALGSAWLPWSPASREAAGTPTPITAVPADEPARGLIFSGLQPARKGSTCVGQYEVSGTEHCSHGPDAVPPGLKVAVDVAPVARTAPAPRLPDRDTRTPSDSDVVGDEGGVLSAGEVALAPDAAAAPMQVGPNGVVCDGDGQAGKRVQVLYVYGAGTASRFSKYEASVRTWAAGVDTIYDASAQETGGSRHLRYVTTADCQVDVREIEVSAEALKTFNGTITALRALGHNRSDRKYMIFADAKVYCGIGSFAGDQQAGAGNRSNGGPSYGRTDSGCWNAGVAAHELGHNLGAVNNSAPNSSKSGHCVDEYDVMCYKDGPSAQLRTACSDRSHDQRLDCNHDDYYHTNPSPGSYLATHWNVANSQYLLSGAAVPPVVGTPAPTPRTPSPAPPTSAVPSPVVPSPSVIAPTTTGPTTGPTAGPTTTAGPALPPTGSPTAPVPATATPAGSPSASPTASPTTAGPGHLAVLAVGATAPTSVRLSWPAAAASARYGIAVDGRTLGWTAATGVRLTGLRPDTSYRIQIMLRTTGSATRPYTDVVAVRTPAAAQPTAGAWFTLTNALTGTVADLYGARSADATPVVVQRGTGSANQLWQLVPAGASTYLLRSKATGKCVAPRGAVTAGAPLTQRACATAQRWTFASTDAGFTLTAADSDLVIGLGRGRFGDHRVLVLQSPNGNKHQTWTA